VANYYSNYGPFQIPKSLDIFPNQMISQNLISPLIHTCKFSDIPHTSSFSAPHTKILKILEG